MHKIKDFYDNYYHDQPHEYKYHWSAWAGMIIGLVGILLALFNL